MSASSGHTDFPLFASALLHDASSGLQTILCQPQRSHLTGMKMTRYPDESMVCREGSSIIHEQGD